VKLNQLAGLRGICAWWVVFYHSLHLMNDSVPLAVKHVILHGYLAVDLFFLLSGFVIFLSYHATLSGNFPHSIGKFYWNRLSRIYPLHLVMLCTYLALFFAYTFLSNSRTAPGSYTVTNFVQSMFLIQMWIGSDLTWNVPSWSISSEWFVYLFFPLMAFSLRKLRGSIAAHLLSIALAAAILYMIYRSSSLESLGAEISRMALVRTMLEFLMGVFVGSLFVNHRAFLARHSRAALVAVIGLCVLYVSVPVPDYALIPLTFAFLIAYLSVTTSWITAALSAPVLVYLGEISYSTYMVHYLVYDILKAGFVEDTHNVNQLYLWLSFASVFILSMLLHHGVDMPSQKYFRRISKRQAQVQ
jgi:peptidoglycan/LPS O-acetylase OafA/YrhL